MKKISSRLTFLAIKIFPAFFLCVAGLVFVLGASLVILVEDKTANPPFLSGLFLISFSILIILVYFFVVKKFTFDIVDEAFDEGSTLLLKKRTKEVRIKPSDIKIVGYQWSSPPKVTLNLRIETELGTNISFIPPFRLNIYKKPAIVTDLIDRIEDAKRNQLAEN